MTSKELELKASAIRESIIKHDNYDKLVQIAKDEN